MVLPLVSMAHDPHKGDDIFIYYFYLQPQRTIHLCTFTWRQEFCDDTIYM